jgi:protoporphyrinogen oxidase
MGRFFPHAQLHDIIANMREADNKSYNTTFTYPKNGAIMYVKALADALPAERIRLQDGIVRLDVEAHRAWTAEGTEITYDRLISSAPFDRFLKMADIPHDPSVFSSNQVLVFNLGFDTKGPDGVHWIYVPEKRFVFYRIGFYDNILDTDRMSLYVEIGTPSGAVLNVPELRERVLHDLKELGIVTTQKLVAEHSVVLNPAYVHISESSRNHHRKICDDLRSFDVHSIGRYGGWTYCSIEDNIIEAQELAEELLGS